MGNARQRFEDAKRRDEERESKHLTAWSRD